MDSRPFFVVGVQRSGTTVLRLMLNSHPNLAVPFESHFLKVLPTVEAVGPLTDEANQRRVLATLASEPFTMKGGILVDPEEVLEHRVSSFGELVSAVFLEWAKTKGKRRWGNKTPGYVVEMDTLCSHFPDAQFVHIVRDGRDVALSNKVLSWGNKSLLQVAEDWKDKVLLGRKMGRILGDERYLEVRYEDLIRDAEIHLRRICRFLGEDYDPAMLEYHKNAERELPRSSLQWHRSSVSRLDESKVFAWRRRMPVADQILFEECAGDVLELFGYERMGRRPTFVSRLKRAYYAAF